MKRNRTKEDLHAQLNRKLEDQREAVARQIDALDPRLLKYYEASYYGDFVGLLLSRKVTTMKGLYAHLRVVSKNVGRYKIQNYWVPYEGNVQINYKVNGTTVRYQVEAGNVDAVIAEISGGKCKVVSVEKREVQCELAQ